MKAVLVFKKTKKILKEGWEDFWKLKKMGGDEGTILKHKVKAKEEKRLTNIKPILDIMSQCKIPILWSETKQKY